MLGGRWDLVTRDGVLSDEYTGKETSLTLKKSNGIISRRKKS